MIIKLISLVVLGVACGLLQKSANNRNEEPKDENTSRERTPADKIKDGLALYSNGLSVVFASSFSILFLMMALSVVLTPLTVPALILSAAARASYIYTVKSLIVTSAFLIGNVVGHKLDTRTESNSI